MQRLETCIDPSRITALTLPANLRRRRQISINICRYVLQHTGCIRMLLLIDETDKRTDRRTPYRYTYARRGASKISIYAITIYKLTETTDVIVIVM